MGQNKARCTIQFIDASGKPIKNLNYWLKDKNGYQIAKGKTNLAGMSYELVQDIGTEVNVFVEKYKKSDWKKLKTFYLSDRFQIIRLESPKVLLESVTVDHDGTIGQYERKTHEVKKGDTLWGVAQKYGVTVRALAQLNKIEDINRLAIGQVIKLPVKTPVQASSSPSTQSQNQSPNSVISTNNTSSSINQPTSGSVDRIKQVGDEFTYQESID